MMMTPTWRLARQRAFGAFVEIGGRHGAGYLRAWPARRRSMQDESGLWGG